MSAVGNVNLEYFEDMSRGLADTREHRLQTTVEYLGDENPPEHKGSTSTGSTDYHSGTFTSPRGI